MTEVKCLRVSMAEGRRRVFVSMVSLRKAGLCQEGSKNSWEVAACC